MHCCVSTLSRPVFKFCVILTEIIFLKPGCVLFHVVLIYIVCRGLALVLRPEIEEC